MEIMTFSTLFTHEAIAAKVGDGDGRKGVKAETKASSDGPKGGAVETRVARAGGVRERRPANMTA
jgi:hypothetical protein